VHANNAATRAGKAASATSRATSTSGSSLPTTSGGVIGAGTANPAVTASINARRGLLGSSSSLGYTYGAGSTARRYRAFGYGSGYRNRSYGAGYGYGRSQGINRAIVARLQSVHAQLARLNQDYQGHRSRAMHSITMAIRQLSHRSMVYSGVGFAPGMNDGMGVGMRRSMLGGAGRGGQRMPQTQSDAVVSHALRSLQGIGMQLTNQGSYNMGHARARGHVGHAINELNLALSIR
jgi:hypothetical protein